jgi:hypothetical protein
VALTRDHTVAQALVDAGALSFNEMAHSPHKHRLIATWGANTACDRMCWSKPSSQAIACCCVLTACTVGRPWARSGVSWRPKTHPNRSRTSSSNWRYAARLPTTSRPSCSPWRAAELA